MHTPGPWSINEWPQATSDLAIGAVGTPRVAMVPLRDVSINEQKANAALIAAAPDMHKVLLRILGNKLNDGVNDTETAMIRAALAKADGN